MATPKIRGAGTGMHLAALARSPLYREYQRAFTQATGLPLALHEPQMLGLVRYFRGRQNRFCCLMARKPKTCAACYALQQRLEEGAPHRTRSLKCFASLWESAVPVRLDEKLVAYLHTGQVLLERPTRSGFNRVADQLRKRGAGLRLEAAEQAWFQTPFIPPGRYRALVGLLEVFAQHLTVCGNQLLLLPSSTEPAWIVKARSFINAHHAEELSLERVARHLHISTTHFSRRFKQVTGLAFSDYVARARVETAKRLLRDSRLRITAIALDAGFQSVSQFNRAFKKITGRSPKEFRRE